MNMHPDNYSKRDLEKATKILDNYDGDVDDFFKIWPQDKTYFFASDSSSFVAYAINHKVAVCMGNPVGPTHSIKNLLHEFARFAKQNELTIAFIQTTGDYQKLYSNIGLKNILIGADAVVNLNTFNDITIHNKYFRNLVNRYNRNQYYVDSYKPPHSQSLIEELRVISSSWVNLPNRKEWSFLTGSFENDYLQQVPIHVLRDKTGIALAFVNELPEYKKGVATIDLMRHRADAPSNSIDMLFINLFITKHEAGYSGFNLGMSPLDGRPFIKKPLDRMLISVFGLTNSFIGFKGLHQFKSKYEPEWEPRYVWYTNNNLYIPKIGYAVYRLMTKKTS